MTTSASARPDISAPLLVVVIIPAYNAATTIAATVSSLQSQRYPHWEALVVDDGSTDATATLVADLADHEPRLRLLRQPNAGVSAARNLGIAAAQGPWLLFLDADDLITSDHLELLTAAITVEPDAAVAYGGWARLAPDDSQTSEQCWQQSGDLFPLFARVAAFPIHAGIVRRELVVALGAFDVTLRTCEDWDLWQRIARSGAHFVAIPEVIALYRMRPTSASIDGRQMLLDGLKVITRGHGADLRMPPALVRHPTGMPAAAAGAIRAHYTCWPAGLALGAGADPLPLLDLLPAAPEPGVDPYAIAETLFRAALLPGCHLPSAWPTLWPSLEPQIDRFLAALQAKVGVAGLAPRTRRHLERLVLTDSVSFPVHIGAIYAVSLELTAPIADQVAPPTAELLYCTLFYGGEQLGTLELPICDGLVPGWLIADAAANALAWPLLGRFLAHTIYPQLRAESDATGIALWRSDLRLADGLPALVGNQPLVAHDWIGWAIFLQEIWGCPALADAAFYDPASPLDPSAFISVADDQITIEVSAPLPSIKLTGTTLYATFTVGGAAIGVVPIPAPDQQVTAGALRAALTTASGMELCRAAVREGLIGVALTDAPTSLRERVAAAAMRRAQQASSHSAYLALANGATQLLTSRAAQPIGSSAGRYAVLPAACAADLAASAAMVSEGSLTLGTGPVQRVAYLPDLSDARSVPQRGASALIEPEPDAPTTLYNRSFFEALFARTDDPWRYTGPYEQTKYEQTLSLLPRKRARRALEIACAEGHFTVQLAPHVGKLLATDISQIALDRSAQRCAGQRNVRFALFDMNRDPIDGQYDLIVCSEVLYYVGDQPALQIVATKIAAALLIGGYLLIAHAHQLVDDPSAPGFDWELPFGAKVIGETFASIEGMQLISELRTPAYRIQLFQRQRERRLLPWPKQPQPPTLVESAQPTALPPSVAGAFSWQGGHQSTQAIATVSTDRLPILMYHRVAPTGEADLRRYRVTPTEFEEQLRYLRDGGYYSVSLAAWQRAAAFRRSLPGRAVLITFDDGYEDVATYAWPLLRQYGFTATVFLVGDRVGQASSWDSAFGSTAPLMGWETIKGLHAAGLSFGSHTMSHAPLTALSPAEVVAEAARSRQIIAQELGAPVDAFAYPYGDMSPAVQHLIGACGYVFGLSCVPGRCGFQSPLLALPRIEVLGGAGFAEFVAGLSK